jgi:hypothetical protein
MAMVSYARWSEKNDCDTADLAAGTWITTCGGGAAGAMREGKSERDEPNISPLQ